MTEDAKELRRAYIREWRKKNPDKVRAAQDRYWEKKAARIRKMTLIENARHLKSRGLPMQQISEILGIDQEKVNGLLKDN